jgi:hypothetical protein
MTIDDILGKKKKKKKTDSIDAVFRVPWVLSSLSPVTIT